MTSEGDYDQLTSTVKYPICAAYHVISLMSPLSKIHLFDHKLIKCLSKLQDCINSSVFFLNILKTEFSRIYFCRNFRIQRMKSTLLLYKCSKFAAQKCETIDNYRIRILLSVIIL